MKLFLRLTLVLLLFFNSLYAFQGTTYVFEGPEGDWTDESLWKDGLYPGTEISSDAKVEIQGDVKVGEDVLVRNQGEVVLKSTKGSLQIEGSFINIEESNLQMEDDTSLLIVSAGSFKNEGNIVYNNECLIEIQDSEGKFTNNKNFNASLDLQVVVNSKLLNYGTVLIEGIRAFNSKFNIDRGMEFINKGEITNINSEFRINSGTFENNGKLINKSSRFIVFNSTFTNQENSSIENNGRIIFISSSNILNYGTWDNNGPSSNLEISSGSTFVQEENGDFKNEGSITVAFGAAFVLKKELVNNGIFTIRSSPTGEISQLRIENEVDFINFDSVRIRDGELINSGTFINEKEGVVSNYGSFLTETVNSHFINKGLLEGDNQVHTGNFNNTTGTIRPNGEFFGTLGTYQFDDEFSISEESKIFIEIAEETSSLIEVPNDTISLLGNLHINVFNRSIGKIITSTEYSIIKGKYINGTFDKIITSNLSNDQDVEVIYDTNEIRIKVIERTLFEFEGPEGSWTDVSLWKDNRYPGVTTPKNALIQISGKAFIDEGIEVTNQGVIELVDTSQELDSTINAAVIINGKWINTEVSALSLKDSTAIFLSGNGMLENEGIINYSRDGLIELNSDTARLINRGRISNSNQSSVGSNFLNGGTILNEENGILFIESMSITNNNQFVNDGGIGISFGDFQNNGTFENNGGISIDESNFKNENSGVFINEGEFDSSSFSSISNSGDLTITENGRISIGEDGFFFHLSEGNFMNKGEFNIFSGDAFIDEDFTNNGKILIVQEDFQSGGGQMTIRSEAILTNNGEIIIAEGDGTNNIVGGNLINEGGTLINEKDGLITNEDKIIQDENSQVINRGNFLANNSSHTGAFVNESGTLGLGVSSEFIDASKATYTYTLTDGWEQVEEGTLQIRILESTSDQVVSPNGTVTLSGKLEVNFLPSPDTTNLSKEFVIIEAENIAGTFDNLDVFNLPENKNFEIMYTNTEVRLKLEDNRVLNTSDNPFSEIKLVTDLRNQEIHLQGLKGEHTLSIYDMHGRKVLDNEMTAPLTQNISELAKGAYILKIDNTTNFYRFVK